MVAMSMADGYARHTLKPQAVIVHVDVGTQGLGAAVHNASTGRAPILLFAGLSPFTQNGELRGSRTEFIHWIQDVPDQKAIVAQYCRYAGELRTGLNVREMVNRALQFARSDPMGPVYLCGAREVMEAEVPEGSVRQGDWEPVRLGGLPAGKAEDMAAALVNAKAPLLLTGYVGRNQGIIKDLVKLADGVKRLRVLDTGGSDMCFPADHPAWLGLRYGVHDAICSADVILVLDCDVPWIPTQCRPREDARIFHVDVDPLKQMMPVFYIPAQERYKADAQAVVEQLNAVIAGYDEKKTFKDQEAEGKRKEEHGALVKELDAKFGKPLDDGTFGTGFLCRTLRRLCPADTIWAVEAVTNTVWVHNGLMPTLPGSWVNCGGGGLGWSGGAAMGIKLASEYENGKGKGKFVVAIVGDGTYLFSVPGSVYWIARRYGIPVLTIVLNNKGESIVFPPLLRSEPRLSRDLHRPPSRSSSSLQPTSPFKNPTPHLPATPPQTRTNTHQGGTPPATPTSSSTPTARRPAPPTRRSTSRSTRRPTTPASPRRRRAASCTRRGRRARRSWRGCLPGLSRRSRGVCRPLLMWGLLRGVSVLGERWFVLVKSEGERGGYLE